MICDTNNFAQGADKIVIGNNKSAKSLGIIFYLLARGYCKARGIEVEVPDLEWWVSEEEVVEEKKPRKKFERVDAEYGV
jgi:ribosomal protein S2